MAISRSDLPAGAVTFLFTDVEGSTKLLHALGEREYADALAEHHRIVRAGVQRCGGVEVDTQGDALFVAFADASEAIPGSGCSRLSGTSRPSSWRSRAPRTTCAAGNGVGTSACRLGLASLANKTGRHDRAHALLAENLPFVQSKGQTRCEAYTLAGMAETSVYGGRLEHVGEISLRGAKRASQIDDRPLIAYLVDLLAVGAAARGEARLVATLLGATEAAREAMGAAPDDEETAIRNRALELLGAGPTTVADAWAAGRRLDLGSALKLAEEGQR